MPTGFTFPEIYRVFSACLKLARIVLTGNSLETDLSVASGQERKRRSGDWCGTIQKNRGVPAGVGAQRAARLAGDPGVGAHLGRGDLARLSRPVLTRSAPLRLILRLSEFAAGPGLASRLVAQASEFAIGPVRCFRRSTGPAHPLRWPQLTGPRLAARPCGVRRSRRSTGPARQPRDPRG